MAGQTEEGSYRVGDTFDGVTLVAGKVEKTGSYVAGDTFDGVTLVAGLSEEMENFIDVDFGDLVTDMTTLAATDITTVATAQGVITDIDAGITLVSDRRACFGAAINRLTHAVDNLTSVSLGAKASVSRIEDTDYAIATSDLASTQIIQEAASAMLAQANQLPQTVLVLLE